MRALFENVVGVSVLFILLTPLACHDSGSGGSSTLREPPGTFAEAGGKCISCHLFIEDAHPERLLYCTDCHGGDDTTRDMAVAHVEAAQVLPANPIILPVDYPDADYLRFLNPSNLRVVRQTCGKESDGFGGSCHADMADRIFKSMMATTAGHLAGGAYQNGLLPDRTAIWGNMPVEDLDGEIRGGLAELAQLPPEDTTFAFDSIERHYSDAPRKICIRCHLWSRGKAVRGVPGQEGNYRSEGCAACHMPYANDGLSRSGDYAIDKTEVGHPVTHTLTRKIPTEQCAHCHTRGARIGLSFQGLSQLPPGTPTGPDYPGLTPDKIYGAYHVQDPSVNPPDIHTERGMHCIDCHVLDEIMGDGNIYGHMDQATEIECEDCHGTVLENGDLVTARGTALSHVRIEPDGTYVLRSKATDEDHVVPQVLDFTNPAHPTFNDRASRAMTSEHLKETGGLECYACHAAWQNNCWGCHFERDLGGTALDMLAGEETYGSPKTDKKYFLNFKNFQMGYNAEGKVAPYVVGCQVLTTVIDENGQKLLDQEMPETAGGFSGLGMNPVNPHTTRPTPRWCVECHRSAPSLGTGSETFTLLRTHLYASETGSSPGIAILDRKDSEDVQRVGFLELDDPRGLAVQMNEITGSGEFLYIADAQRGLVAVDARDPSAPRIADTHAAVDPRHVDLTSTHLYLANGSAGLEIYDISDPFDLRQVGTLGTFEARAVRFSGTYALVAAGADGLAVVDVLDPTQPRLAAMLDLNGSSPDPNEAADVFLFSHYFNPPAQGPKEFLLLAYVAAGSQGVRVVDWSNPEAPEVILTLATSDARRVYVASLYDAGSESERSFEREYLYVADGAAGLRIFDVAEDGQGNEVGSYAAGGAVVDIVVAHAFEPPLNKLYGYLSVAGGGLHLLDLSITGSPVLVRAYPGITTGIGLAPERIRLDRFVNEAGQKVKDSSHDGARPFTRAEMDRILRADLGGR